MQPARENIPKIRCFSLTDLHDFDYCPFRFFVKHHLGKKYEIDESNPKIALGVLLDESIKKFHDSKSYGMGEKYLINLVTAAYNHLREESSRKGPKSFIGVHVPYLTEEVLQKAIQIFQDYYQGLEGRIKHSIGYVGFCEWVIASESGKIKIWGGPDTFELGDDGVPEICDYKYHEDSGRGKSSLDMDLMPKMYTLLGACRLKQLGNKDTHFRFCVRLWQEPGNNSLYEEFDESAFPMIENLCKQKIERILSTIEFRCCEKPWCKACQSTDRLIYLRELAGMNLKQLDNMEAGVTWNQPDRLDPAA